MKKIMFNDKVLLTQAVLEGRKIKTRRICKYNRPDETYDIAFPVFEPNDYDNDGNIISPLDGAFCWRNDKGDFTGWNIPKYKVGEVVAIAQNYRSITEEEEEINGVLGIYRIGQTYFTMDEMGAGWNNKMFVKSKLMPHHIRITDIKIERLQDISDADCLREGVLSSDKYAMPYGIPDSKAPNKVFFYYSSPREAFAALIDKISGKGVWDSNPYVFAYEFELVD